MPTDGLSLVGFMDQAQAVQHLKTVCVPDPSKNDVALIQDWTAATGQLGPPIAGAGYPTVTPIDLSDPHIAGLTATWGAVVQQFLAAGSYFAWVEVDKLLAFQFTVDQERSQHHCGQLHPGSTQQEIMEVCLPSTPRTDAVHASGDNNSIVLLSRSLNLSLHAAGPLAPDHFGIRIGWNLPFVHVVEYNGRCYLHNGYHRTLGVRMAGHVLVPCLYRPVSTAEEAGIHSGTFQEHLLTSANPPTVGHFAQGRACDVKLRAATRVITVNWSQHIMFSE